MSEGTPAGLKESPAGSVQHGELPGPVQRATPMPTMPAIIIVIIILTNLFLQATEASLLQSTLQLGPEVGWMEKCIPGQRKGLKIF